jgi:hypothetical protein
MLSINPGEHMVVETDFECIIAHPTSDLRSRHFLGFLEIT